MPIDFSVEPEFQEKLDWIGRLMREDVFPLEVLELDHDQLLRLIEPLRRRVKEQELFAPHLDPSLGGQGFGQVKLGLMHELLGQSRLGPLVFGAQAPDSGNSEILALHATEEQKEKWLHPLLRGELHSAYAMTEPDAGADPTRLSASAVLDGEEWVLNGEKWFITNASIADFFIFMVVTDPDAAPHERASQIIVEAGTPGLTVVREIGTLEDDRPVFGRWDNHAVVELRDVRVPVGNLLGERGTGFAVAQQRLGPGRIHHAMRWIGQARRAYDMLCERSLYREAHGSTLAEKQTIQNWIADSAVEIEAARLLTLKAAWVMDEHGSRAARREISMIKFWGAKILHDVIDRALQIHGSLGYSSDMPLESMYRYARAARIYDGPDEVHRQSVARLTLREYSPPADGIPSEHVPTRRAKAQLRFEDALEELAGNA
ncbi:MAG TPA: acyl-CoA dehydrogenase family protein [Solirubrobacterales bacterium]|nr:acyl-CoA dehydrogenase family protein [Solirubrobacterales bacterium]